MTTKVKETTVKGTSVKYTPVSAHFDGMSWPTTGQRAQDLDWRLRYGKPTESDLLYAASIISAYDALVHTTATQRSTVVRILRAVEELSTEQETNSEPEYCDAGMRPAIMDASDGPVCGCGRLSKHESGWCGLPSKPVPCRHGVVAKEGINNMGGQYAVACGECLNDFFGGNKGPVVPFNIDTTTKF